ncbi:MAG: glycosyltransferase family 2 protein [Candidatus Sumerlaeota bacterium]|nr:glycosyltransferase family 2 protein [Candidatus Sumerlaeota bacterium]
MMVSLVIPVFNEEEMLPRLFGALSRFISLEQTDKREFEVVLVNDGSRDASWALICGQHEKDPRFRGVCLSRNFGHQLALTAGLDCARGDAIVAMDADLQDSPEVVGQLIAEWEAGHDIVYGQRVKRHGESRFKLWTAHGFYRLMRLISRDRTPYDVGDFYLLSRRALDRLKAMREHHRYLRGMIFWLGFQPKAVPYQRLERKAGVTKFSVARMVRFALDGIISSSTMPLYLASYLGFASAVVGLILTVWSFVVHYFQPGVVRGWASTVIIILFLGGIQLISIGILGLYLARVYDEVRGRPLYIVRENTPGTGGQI